MQVRLFSAVIHPGTSDVDAFELEINSWLNENDDIEILSMTVSTSERDGEISMVFFVVYDEEPADEEELTVSLPRVQFKELSELIPKLK